MALWATVPMDPCRIEKTQGKVGQSTHRRARLGRKPKPPLEREGGLDLEAAGGEPGQDIP